MLRHPLYDIILKNITIMDQCWDICTLGYKIGIFPNDIEDNVIDEVGSFSSTRWISPLEITRWIYMHSLKWYANFYMNWLVASSIMHSIIHESQDLVNVLSKNDAKGEILFDMISEANP